MRMIKRTIPVNKVAVYLNDGEILYFYVPVGEPVTLEDVKNYLPVDLTSVSSYEVLPGATYETFTLSEGEFIRNSILEKETKK